MSDLSLRAALLVAGGAIVGALARWVATSYLAPAFPWGTLAVNLLGSFVIGALLLSGALSAEPARLLLAVGILGSFTTMSAFAADTVLLVEEGAYTRAAVHALGHPLLCVAAAFLGGLLGRLVAAS